MGRSRRPRSQRAKDNKDIDRANAEKTAGVEPKPQHLAMPPLKVGQRVRLVEPFHPAGGRSNVGTVTRAGELIDVKWDDGRVSFMMTAAVVEPDTSPAPEKEP